MDYFVGISCKSASERVRVINNCTNLAICSNTFTRSSSLFIPGPWPNLEAYNWLELLCISLRMSVGSSKCIRAYCQICN